MKSIIIYSFYLKFYFRNNSLWISFHLPTQRRHNYFTRIRTTAKVHYVTVTTESTKGQINHATKKQQLSTHALTFRRMYTISALTLCYKRNALNSLNYLLCKYSFALIWLPESSRLNSVNHLLSARLYFMICPRKFLIQNSQYADISKN